MGMYVAFKHDLQEAFTPYNVPGDVLEKIKSLRMKGNNLIDCHIAKFKMLVTGSKLGSNSATIIDLYQESLLMTLQ